MVIIYSLFDGITWWGAAITLAFFVLQMFFFCGTIKKMKCVRAVFPSGHSGRYVANKDVDSVRLEYVSENGNAAENKFLVHLLDELNDYFRKNSGTTDFSIIQHKTDRFIDTMYEDAVSRISFPTYLGLMGTFLGVLSGLLLFNVADGEDLVTDEKVSNLINGVLVSMVTSFIGLLLSTISNYWATNVKRDLDEKKNRFYEFVQNELMPELGTSMVKALSKLHRTINSFQPAFDGVISRFQSTFEECTNSFGEAFRTNVTVVADAVAVMSSNMKFFNEAIGNQKELLGILKSNQLNKTLDKFVASTSQFGSLADSMSLLYQVKEEIILATNDLLKTQSEYCKSLAVPQKIAHELNDILNRIITFEDSINALGANISDTQLLGNRQMNLINEQLSIIKSKNEQAATYADIANEQLKSMYEVQVNAINDLSEKYRASIENHSEELKDMVDRMSEELKTKWDAFKSMLDSSFDIRTVQEDFGYLRNLGTIDKKVSELFDGVRNIQGTVKALAKIPRSGNASQPYYNRNRMAGDTPNEPPIERNVSGIRNGGEVQILKNELFRIKEIVQSIDIPPSRKLKSEDLDSLRSQQKKAKKNVEDLRNKFSELKQSMSSEDIERMESSIKDLEQKLLEKEDEIGLLKSKNKWWPFGRK